MSADEELRALKTALRRWANSTDYKEACRNWSEIKRLMNLHVPSDVLAAEAANIQQPAGRQ